MAQILPFKGFLPASPLAEKIVTHSADNYTLEEAKKIVQENPLSYLSIIYPDFIDHQKTPPHSLARFNKIYQRFQYFIQQNYLIQDKQPTYYIYQQQHPDTVFNGIIAAIHIKDYTNGTIKIHEQTLKEREQKLKEYLKHCKINAEPVLFFYEKNPSLENILLTTQKQEPFISIQKDKIFHRLWKLSDSTSHQLIQSAFSKMSSVYIGDGHHRSASSVLLAQELHNANKSTQYFLGAFFQEDHLKIFSFHRLLKHLPVPENLLDQLKEYFDISELSNTSYPLHTTTIGMYVHQKRYGLKLKRDLNNDILATEILYHYILKPIFHIDDIRHNPYIQYVPAYTCSIQQAEQWINQGKYVIGFFTHPVSTEVIKHIADQHQTMPPKSTYILPKLLNGLVMYSLENSMEEIETTH